MQGYNSETVEQYKYAYKLGKRQLRKDKLNGNNQYLQSLEEIVNIYDCSVVDLGEIEIPVELIVGTTTKARGISFASNFMPIIRPGSEFEMKWTNVCKYHLSDEGIADAPIAYEYLGKFYIEEGNKRISVIKSFGAVFINCEVKRLLPSKSDDISIKLYYEFLDYYKLSRLYSIQFNKLGYYKKLHRLMEFEEEHIWTKGERARLVGLYERLCSFLEKKNIKSYYPDSLVVLIEIYGYNNLIEMTDKELYKTIEDSRRKIVNDKAHFKILCVADEEKDSLWNGYHANDIKEYDFIISAGDLKANYLEYLVTVSNKPLFYVHGNHDDNYDVEEPGGCTCIDDKVYEYCGIRILGLGGSIRYNDSHKYMYTEKQMKKRIRKLKFKIRKLGGIDIIVAHAPAKGYGDLNDYAHHGFECFVDLIKEYHPKYFFYGHVHSRYNVNNSGYYELGGTQIINISGKHDVIY